MVVSPQFEDFCASMANEHCGPAVDRATIWRPIVAELGFSGDSVKTTLLQSVRLSMSC